MNQYTRYMYVYIRINLGAYAHFGRQAPKNSTPANHQSGIRMVLTVLPPFLAIHKLGHKREQAAQHSGFTRNSTTKRQLNGVALIQATDKCGQNINTVANLMTTLVEKRTSPSNSGVILTPATTSSTPPCIPKKRSFMECLEDVVGFANMRSRSWTTLALVQIQSTWSTTKSRKKKVITKPANANGGA